MMTLDRAAPRVWRRYASAAVALWAIACAVSWSMAWAMPAADAAGPSAFSTIFGGLGQDYASSLATDPQGNIYVAGLTYSSDLPRTPFAAQYKLAGTSRR